MNSMKKVCVVDDDALYIYGIKRLLTKNTPENEVSTFESAERALLTIQKMFQKDGSLPDVILLDLNMPKMNGWEFLKQFEELRKETDKEIKVFVISSQVREKQQEVYRVEWNQNVSDFIQKPVDAQGIMKLLQQD